MDWGVPGRKRVEEKSQLFFCLYLFLRPRNHFQPKFLAITHIDIVLHNVVGEVYTVWIEQILSDGICNEVG